MKTLRRFPATALAFFLVGTPAPGRPEVLGVVVEAHLAHLNSSVVSVGTTVYDGDQFSTEEGGTLRLRSDAAMLELGEKSDVVVGMKANSAKENEATLMAGTVAFSSRQAMAMEIHVKEARIRPLVDAATVGQVSVVGPKELRVYARRGDLLFSYGGETEIVGEGKAYRVVLDPPDDDGKKEQTAKKAARRHRAFLLIAIGVAAAIAGIPRIFFHGMPESPDRP
jgi:hypothetical protein